MTTKWMKWRHSFAYGSGGPWKWLEVSPEEWALQEVVTDLAEKYSYSDKYRGVEYELFDVPDSAWLEDHIKFRINQANSIMGHVGELEKLLETLPPPKCMTHYLCGTCKGEYDRGFTDRGQDLLRKNHEVLRYVGEQEFYCCLCGAYDVPGAVFQARERDTVNDWCRNKHDTDPPEGWDEP